MDTDEIEVGIVNLPDDWWQYATTCQALSELFIQHLLSLFLSVEINGQTQHGVYTGFLFYYREHLLWVTAGHVIDEIRYILSAPNASIAGMRWLDNCAIPGAESIPVHHRDMEMFSANESGIDFGVVKILGLDRANILRNDQVKPMTEQVWKNVHLAQPEGYYVLGYPKEWGELSEKRISENQVLCSFRANLACLPVSRIEYRGADPTDEFWNDPEAFYGQIMPFVDVPWHQPESVVGMSGGPLFSIERDINRQIRYRLFGIQRSWRQDERIIRAEPIHRIIGIMTE